MLHKTEYEDRETGFLEFDHPARFSYVTQDYVQPIRELAVTTDGVGRCSVLILKNRTTNAGLFFHLGELAYRRTVNPIEVCFELFLSEPGEKVGLLISNPKLSYPLEAIVEMLSEGGVIFLKPMHVDSGNYPFDLAYRPSTNEILCNNSYEKSVTIYKFEELSSRPLPALPEGYGPNLADRVEAAKKWWTKIDKIMSNRDTIYPNADLFEQCEGFLELPVITASRLMKIFSEKFADVLSRAASNDEMSEKTEDFIPLLKYTMRFIEKFDKFPETQSVFLSAFRQIIRAVTTSDNLIFSVETLESCIDQATQFARAFPDSATKILRWIETTQAKLDATRPAPFFCPY